VRVNSIISSIFKTLSIVPNFVATILNYDARVFFYRDSLFEFFKFYENK